MTSPSRHKRVRKQACRLVGKLGAYACKCLFWVCCGPCVLCAICLIKPRRRGCVIRAKPYDPPRPTTPEPRLRRLTLPLIEGLDDQRTFDQSQSLFINKLPLELRRMVYIETLGGTTIKLRTIEGKPFAQRYRCHIRSCKNSGSPFESELRFGLTLLRTCRQIYSEAIEFLYTSNAFSLSTWNDEHATIDYMSYYFLPHRLTQVRRLRMDWELDSFSYNHFSTTMPGGTSSEAWRTSWDALRAMNGLRQLRIILYFRWREVIDCYEEHWKEHEQELLDPVKTITAPADFVLVLPDRRCSIKVDMGSSKCVLQLPQHPPSPEVP